MGGRRSLVLTSQERLNEDYSANAFGARMMDTLTLGVVNFFLNQPLIKLQHCID
jgi:hypothetical protein